MPNLGSLIAEELAVELNEVILLRHAINRTNKLRNYDAPIDDYTLVQPVGTKYDFLAYNPPKTVVVAIVDELVYSVHIINGVAEEGTNTTLGSANYQAFEQAQAAGRHPVPAVRFVGVPIKSKYIGKSVLGWTSPYNAVAKYGGRLFANVEILL